MKQIIHILKKDIHRYAWAWISLCCLAALKVYLHGTTAGLMGGNVNDGLAMLSSMLGGILFFILVVMMVQEETLVDPDADWVSRPVHRGKLLASKLLGLLLLLGIFQLAEVAILFLNGGHARTTFALLDVFPALAVWLAQVFLAAQTRSLPRYLLLIVCIYVGFMLIMFLSMFANVLSVDLDWGLLPATTPGHIAALIQTLYWLAAGIGILVYMYSSRHIHACWFMLIPVAVVALLLSPGSRFTRNFGTIENDHLKLQHLTKSGNVHSDGQNLVEIRAVFAVSEIPDDTDLWATIHSPSIHSGDKKIAITPMDMVQKYRRESGNLRSVVLGYAPHSKLAELEDEFSVDFNQTISSSRQVRVDRLPLRERAAHVANGNRLVIQYFYHNNDELTVSLGAAIPSYSLEPDHENAHSGASFESFRGKYSFALGDENGQPLRDFDLDSSFAVFDSSGKGSITTKLPEELQPENHTIIVNARRIINRSHASTAQKTSFVR